MLELVIEWQELLFSLFLFSSFELAVPKVLLQPLVQSETLLAVIWVFSLA